MRQSFDIDVVVVNWNSGGQLKAMVDGLRDNASGFVRNVIVVDNCSSDDSLEFLLKTNYENFHVEIVKNKENKGFGFACNQGAHLCASSYILFLNPDAVVYEGVFSVVESFLLKNKAQRIGVVGVKLIDENGKVAKSCARFPSAFTFFMMGSGLNKLSFLRRFSTHMIDWEHDKTMVVDHVIGAFYLIRNDLFKSLNGFDERFFVYLEDLDLSLRVKKAGWKSIYLTEASAFHAGGGTSSQVKAHRLFYSLRSRIFYAFKHFNLLQAILVLMTTMLIEPLSRMIFCLLKGRFSDVKNMLKGFGMLYCDLPAMLRKARTL